MPHESDNPVEFIYNRVSERVNALVKDGNPQVVNESGLRVYQGLRKRLEKAQQNGNIWRLGKQIYQQLTYLESLSKRSKDYGNLVETYLHLIDLPLTQSLGEQVTIGLADLCHTYELNPGDAGRQKAIDEHTNRLNLLVKRAEGELPY